MEKKLRVAVVGMGRIGWEFHMPTIAAHPGFELVAVVDPLEERLADAKRQYGVNGFADFAAMPAAARPDLAVIASPSHLHAEQAIHAMRNGVDVFCEKPLAMDLAEADRMIGVMRETGRKLMTYQPKRACAETLALKAILAKARIGPIYMIKLAVSAFCRRNDWQAWKKYGGGMLSNYGAHALDLLLYLTGEKVKRVHGILRKIAALGDADDVVKLVMETESGIILDMDINMAAAVELQPMIVFGRHGTIWLAREQKAFVVRWFDPALAPAYAADNGLAARERRYMDAYEHEIVWNEDVIPIADFESIPFYDKVYDHFALDKPSFVPIEQTREVIRIMEECRKSEGV